MWLQGYRIKGQLSLFHDQHRGDGDRNVGPEVLEQEYRLEITCAESCKPLVNGPRFGGSWNTVTQRKDHNIARYRPGRRDVLRQHSRHQQPYRNEHAQCKDACTARNKLHINVLLDYLT